MFYPDKIKKIKKKMNALNDLKGRFAN